MAEPGAAGVARGAWAPWSIAASTGTTEEPSRWSGRGRRGRGACARGASETGGDTSQEAASGEVTAAGAGEAVSDRGATGAAHPAASRPSASTGRRSITDWRDARPHRSTLRRGAGRSPGDRSADARRGRARPPVPGVSQINSRWSARWTRSGGVGGGAAGRAARVSAGRLATASAGRGTAPSRATGAVSSGREAGPVQQADAQWWVPPWGACSAGRSVAGAAESPAGAAESPWQGGVSCDSPAGAGSACPQTAPAGPATVTRTSAAASERRRRSVASTRGQRTRCATWYPRDRAQGLHPWRLSQLGGHLSARSAAFCRSADYAACGLRPDGRPRGRRLRFRSTASARRR